jgi:beta-lactam-binding protein with PASTA domain
MRGITINHHPYKAVYGGSLPAPIWRQVMLGALKGVPPAAFTPPPTVVAGTQVAVPDVHGMPVDIASEQLRAAGFGVVVAPAVNAGPIAAGIVVGTRPPAGTLLPAGSSVTIVPSNGLAPVATPTPTLTPGPTPTKPAHGPPPSPTSPPSPTPSPTKKHGP